MNYPEMRRKDRQLTEEEAYNIMMEADYGVLSLCCGDHPYGVALSHAVKDNTIYFHCAMQGFKLDLIRKNQNGYFLFISEAQTLKSKGSVSYRSCGAIGQLREVEDESEKRIALKLLTDRHMGDEYIAEADDMIEKYSAQTAVYAFRIDNITGKQND